jgi:hypothetical protein
MFAHDLVLTSDKHWMARLCIQMFDPQPALMRYPALFAPLLLYVWGFGIAVRI